jgi:predicted kinase
MVIFVNGSFGIGKTTVARLLTHRLPRSTLFDPEPIGVVLMRLSALRPFGVQPDDFQDLSVWRATSIRLIHLLLRVRGTVVVPMTFSNASYLGQFLASARQRDRETFHYCLTAPLATVRARLTAREGHRGPTEWQLRRSAECCAAHQRPEFAEQIATENQSPDDVADEIMRRITARTRAATAA